MNNQVLAICCVCARCMIALAMPASAANDQLPYLKGVKIISYKLVIEPPNRGRCAVDLAAWNKAIALSASQSSELQLLQEQDRQQQIMQILDELRKDTRNPFQQHSQDAAQEP